MTRLTPSTTKLQAVLKNDVADRTFSNVRNNICRVLLPDMKERLYPSLDAAANTRFCPAVRALSGLRSTLDAVATETSAAWATCETLTISFSPFNVSKKRIVNRSYTQNIHRIKRIVNCKMQKFCNFLKNFCIHLSSAPNAAKEKGTVAYLYEVWQQPPDKLFLIFKKAGIQSFFNSHAPPGISLTA